MTDWPDKPLIRIIRGEMSGKPITNKIAARTENGNFAIANRLCVNNYDGDSIDAWEEVTPVPTATLKHLRDVFLGVELPLMQFAAIQQVVSHLPADKPSALDQAATRVKDVADTPMVDAETLPAECLSLLLDALASVQSATRKAAPLAMVARICVDWADLENPRRDSLEAARERTKVLSDPGSFIVLSALVGDVTTALCDNFSPRHNLIDAGAYALAWAAQTIEEEDK
jgi:hypothetical protein